MDNKEIFDMVEGLSSGAKQSGGGISYVDTKPSVDVDSAIASYAKKNKLSPEKMKKLKETISASPDLSLTIADSLNDGNEERVASVLGSIDRRLSEGRTIKAETGKTTGEKYKGTDTGISSSGFGNKPSGSSAYDRVNVGIGSYKNKPVVSKNLPGGRGSLGETLAMYGDRAVPIRKLVEASKRSGKKPLFSKD